MALDLGAIVALFLTFVFVLVVLRFRRKIHNTYIAWLEHKKFVVVHVQNPATRFSDTFNVVPDFEKTTEVNGFRYCLRKDNAVIEWKGRLHFLVEKDNAIPKTISDRTVNDVALSVYQIRSALRSKAYDILYGEQKNIAFLIALAALVISLLVAIYAIYTLNHINPLVETIYAKIQPEQINIVVK